MILREAEQNSDYGVESLHLVLRGNLDKALSYVCLGVSLRGRMGTTPSL